MRRSILLLMALTGCHQSEECSIASEEIPATTTIEGDSWWDIFHDPILNQLEEKALKSNPTYQAAFFNVCQSFNQMKEVRSFLFPQISLDPNFQQTGSYNAFVTGNAGPLLSERFVQRNYTLPFTMDFEIDLFGKRVDMLKSAWSTWASKEALYSLTRLNLTCDVAAIYYDLIASRKLLKVLEDTITARQAAFEVNQARFTAGQINYSDVSRAGAQVEKARVDLEEMKVFEIIQLTTLAALVGEEATTYSLDTALLEENSPDIPLLDPELITLNSPELIESQYLMLASIYDYESRWKELLPTLSFNGVLGYFSPVKDIITQYRTRLWSWGFLVSQVVFDGGLRGSQIEVAKSIFWERFMNYEALVLSSLQKFETARKSFDYYRRQNIASVKEVAFSKDTLNISKERYDRGLVNYLDVVDAENQLLLSQADEINSRRRGYTSYIDLIRSFGPPPKN